MRCNWALLCGGWLTAIVIGNAAMAVTVSDFMDFSLRAPLGNVILPGRLYVPSVMSTPNSPHPLMTMLHGGGSRGTDSLAQLIFVSDGMIKAADERGVLLYLPQTPDNWSSGLITSRVMTMIDRAVAEWNVDNDRLYMMGYSNGGGGVWNMLSRHERRFAAAMPVSGVAPAADFLPTNLIDTPIWTIHARDDNTVPVAVTRNIVAGILTAAQLPTPAYPPLGSTSDFNFVSEELSLQYSELGVAGHNIWTGVSRSPKIYDWLFAHSLAVPEPSSPILLWIAAIFLSERWRPTTRTRRTF
jgi:predicted peptidase